MLNAKCAVALIDIDVFQQCGTIILSYLSTIFDTFFASVSPPTLPMSGWATSTLPFSIKSPKRFLIVLTLLLKN